MSLTGVTVMVKVFVVVSTPGVVPPLSFNVTVTVAIPGLSELAFGASVNVKVPVSKSIVGRTLNKALLLLVTVRVRVCVLSSAPPPTANPVENPAFEYAPESSNTVTSPALLNNGASLTALTVMTKLVS